MRRVLYIIVVVSVCVFCAATQSFAFYSNDPVSVNSQLQEPVPEIIVNGSSTTYVQYYVVQTFGSSAPNTFLFKITFTVPSSSSVIFRIDHKQFVCINSTAPAGVSYTVDEYDVASGQFIEGYSFTSSSESYLLLSGYTSAFKFRAGYFPIRSGNYDQDVFCFPITNISVSSSSQGSTSHQVWNTNSPSFVQWFTPSSDVVIRSKIPQPLSDLRHMYFADDTYLYQINLTYPVLYQSVGLNGSSVNGVQLTADTFFDQCYVELQKRDISHVNLNVVNRTEQSFKVYISKYDVMSGEFISQSQFTIQPLDSNGDPVIETIPIEVLNANTSGLWYTGFVNTDGLDAFDKLKISWSDTIDYSTDFESIILLLRSLESDILTVNSNLSSIKTVLDTFYSLVNNGISWLESVFYDNLNNKWTVTNNHILSIYNLLNESEETVPIEADTSGVAAMESAKNDLVVTNASGQVVDAGDAAAVGLSEAAQQIGEIAQPVSTINQLMQTIVFDKPKLLLPVIVALGLGLMVTILGKNKSD